MDFLCFVLYLHQNERGVLFVAHSKDAHKNILEKLKLSFWRMDDILSTNWMIPTWMHY